MRATRLIFGVAAIAPDGHESTVSAYVRPPRLRSDIRKVGRYPVLRLSGAGRDHCLDPSHHVSLIESFRKRKGITTHIVSREVFNGVEHRSYSW